MPPIKTKTLDMRAYMREYYLAHKDRINENHRQRMRNVKNRLKQSEYKRAWYLAHREQEIARIKRYNERKKQLRNERTNQTDQTED